MGIIHASGYDWRVSYMLAYPNNMIGYVPRKYNYVIDDLEEVDPETIPSTFALHQNYPNPFNASTTISYDVPQYSFVTLDLYNIRGEPLQNLYHGFQNAQHHTFQWETSHIPSGVYFYRIQIGKWRSVKKCVLIK